MSSINLYEASAEVIMEEAERIADDWNAFCDGIDTAGVCYADKAAFDAAPFAERLATVLETFRGNGVAVPA
jgi:hypothetical protein